MYIWQWLYYAIFCPRKKKDKRKGTEEPSDDRGNTGKRRKEVRRKSGGPYIVVARDSILGHISANGSTTIPVAMATKLGANILKPSLPPNTKEFEKFEKEGLGEAKHKNATARKTRVDYPFA